MLQDSKGQKLSWNAGFNSFFDNTEFAGSEYKIPQTMAGVRFAPGFGLRWDSLFRINAGVDMLHEFGSKSFIDKADPIAFFSYEKTNLRFKMGAFPREGTLDNYPRIFFQDSLYFYRPNVNGIFSELRRNNNYLNVWLDWTGRRAVDVREAFFVGMSGKYSMDMFYIRHFGYYYHFFITSDPADNEALHDNSVFLTSLGADLSGKSIMDKLDINFGWVASFERSRGENTGWIGRNGFLSELRAEYGFIGIFNTIYVGKGLMNFYNDHSNELYWGDPAYRSSSYDRADLYLTFFRKKKIDFKLIYSLNFMEGNLYNEQLLKIGIDLEGR